MLRPPRRRNYRLNGISRKAPVFRSLLCLCHTKICRRIYQVLSIAG